MTLTLYGQPMGKPRMTRRDKWQQRPCVVRYRSFADALRLAANRTTKIHLTKPTRLTVRAYFEHTTHRIGPHTCKPDFDNILKACADSLFANDEMIYQTFFEKRWADGGPARLEVEWT